MQGLRFARYHVTRSPSHPHYSSTPSPRARYPQPSTSPSSPLPLSTSTPSAITPSSHLSLQPYTTCRALLRNSTEPVSSKVSAFRGRPLHARPTVFKTLHCTNRSLLSGRTFSAQPTTKLQGISYAALGVGEGVCGVKLGIASELD